MAGIAFRETKALLTVGAVGVEADFFDAGIFEVKHKAAIARGAFDVSPEIFAIHAQFPVALRTGDVKPAGGQVNHAVDFLERHEGRNFDAVRFQVGVQ